MKTRLILIAVSLLLVTGCAATGPKLDMNQVMTQFYGQTRTCKALSIAGVTDLQIRGSNITLAVEAPLPPLSAMPSDPNRTMMLLDAAKNIALGGLGIWALRDIATQKPEVIQQPAPVIVRPEVIQGTGGTFFP